MSKDIWHTADITPDPYRSFVINTDKRNIYTGIITNPTEWNPMILPEFYGIGDIDKAERAIRYAYLDDLLALETELEHTRKALEQSEICCTEWEKQALDYKAENIALSGDLERTRKVLDKAKWWLNEIVESHRCTPISTAEMALKEIIALEQRD